MGDSLEIKFPPLKLYPMESYITGTLNNKKIEVLKTSKDNFDINIKQLLSASLSEIESCHNLTMHAMLCIKPTPDIDHVIFTDAIESGWEAHDGITSIGGSGLIMKYVTT